MATKVDYANGIDATDIGTVYLTGAGYVNYPFHGVSRDSALGWEEPVWGAELDRSIDLVLDVDNIDYGLVARCEISYKYMNVQDYIALCKIAKQRVCTASFFNRETGERVTQEMAFTGNEVGKLLKFGKDYLGASDVSIKLVATNRDRTNIINATHTITYNANGGSGTVAAQTDIRWAGQRKLADSGISKTGSTLVGWNTQADGYGDEYLLGQSITLFNNLTLYAEWGENVTLKTGSELNSILQSIQSFYQSPYFVIKKIIFDNFTGDNEYVVNGENQIEGLNRTAYADDNNKVEIFAKKIDNRYGEIYILAPKGSIIYANADSSTLFSQCVEMTEIQFNNFKTSNVINMSQMFDSCWALESLDLSKFDTSNVTNMEKMFYHCNMITSLDLSKFDTNNVTNMANMFGYCYSLVKPNLSSFNTSNVTDMSYMFAYSSAIESLDLTRFNTSNVTDMYNMFSWCEKLKKIYVSASKWNTSNVEYSTGMFNACLSIVGGNGTTYNSNYIDKTYARIDAPGTPGYLTEAS